MHPSWPLDIHFRHNNERHVSLKIHDSNFSLPAVFGSVFVLCSSYVHCKDTNNPPIVSRRLHPHLVVHSVICWPILQSHWRNTQWHRLNLHTRTSFSAMLPALTLSLSGYAAQPPPYSMVTRNGSAYTQKRSEEKTCGGSSKRALLSPVRLPPSRSFEAKT